MALEAATYISQLNTANPTTPDSKTQGDDHLRLLKSVLKNQFPNLGAAAVTPTAAQLNFLVGVTSLIQTQLNAKVDDSETAGGSATIPRNSGTLMTSLNADLWDGADLLVKTTNPISSEGTDGDICLVREV